MQVQETYIVKEHGYLTMLYRCLKAEKEWPHTQTHTWVLEGRHMSGSSTGLREISDAYADTLPKMS